MEQPPGSLDDLQPQDLSTSNIAAVIDLTRIGNLNGTSCEVQQVDTIPDWHPNSGTYNPELPSSSETTSSTIFRQSGDHIQPDNALSRTTVTLSYVSRSHIHSNSPLYGVPPISKFSLLPPCEAEKGLGETTYALNQLYLEHVDRPVDLATQAFHSSSQAPETDAIRPPQQLCEFNEEVTLSKTGGDEHCILGRKENSGGLENGQDGSWSSLGVDSKSSPETREDDEEKGRSETPLHKTKNEEPVVAPIELFSSTTDYKRLLEDPVSPSATSPGDVEDVFLLPQASSSPSGDTSFQAEDDSVTEGPIELRSGISSSTTSLNSRSENKQPVHRRKPEPNSLVDLTEDVCSSGISEDKLKTVTPYMNGIVGALQKTVNERKLRSGRGMHLQSIVMNINSSRYKVSGRIKANADASKMRTRDSNATSPKRSDTQSDRNRQGKAKEKQKVTQHKRGKTNSINNDRGKDTTSVNNSNKSYSKASPKSPRFSKNVPEAAPYPGTLPQSSPVRSKRRLSSASSPQPKHSMKQRPAHPDPSFTNPAKCLPPAPKESPKKNPRSAQGQKILPIAKTKPNRAPKRRRKKHKPRQFSSIFSPKEPEIKLKYVHYKEEKRESRVENFSPFIRQKRQQSSVSLCTVVNYPEEVRTQHKKGQRELQDHTSGFISGTVPSTSCLQLGRSSSHGQHQGSLICCLCGLSANAMDLGDLHGPYYPEGYRPSTKASACTSSPKCLKGYYSDSDSSSCSVRGRGSKRAVAPMWNSRLADQFPQSHQRTAENTGSPAAKRARSEIWPTDVEDWYSPPVLPLEPCEYWLHEDCGIWSAGVFLVKGKVYGLEETVKVARETMCSTCSETGATLGCFFKGCPSKYHYRCALEADCVLIEENFSMKCKKHKSKTFSAPVGKQSDPRRKKPS
ncbi:transcription factor 20 [Dunckerocampus dactyliophorus]|uniref:transcription factor 20 n=1 Tax=Dunckerocampus dactyliophorus TaxID=161453 RepID=UPI002406002E|nr:transcription factor 20 [Dunckerocampus dactyliophorus]XP_054613052.1 transcription factor 20 [Dunckerocampus dactyliophorus]XP_054613063.1 transcription factor 20 [Dunckerocampus dactyliophorus]XP_054613073.1 transcription factor 20 [Dunckerocampus dactyliophorus]